MSSQLSDGCTLQHADVYAFGVLMVEMFLGERAFKGMRHPQIIHTIAVLRKHPMLPETAPKHIQVSPPASMCVALCFSGVPRLETGIWSDFLRRRPAHLDITHSAPPMIEVRGNKSPDVYLNPMQSGCSILHILMFSTTQYRRPVAAPVSSFCFLG